MSDSNQIDGGRLWGRETSMPSLTQPPAARPQQVRPDNVTRLRNQRALQQMRTAAAERDDAREYEFVNVRVQWAETTRYEADLYLDPWSSDEAIWDQLANLPDGERRQLDLVESDNRIISVIDLDGDGHIDAYEMSISTGHTVTDWGDVSDRIDEHIAESPSWPRLNAALDAAAAAGFDVAGELPAVAAMGPLPTHDPAGELYYRLLGTGMADVSGDPGASAADGPPPPRRDNPPEFSADPPRVSAPRI